MVLYILAPAHTLLLDGFHFIAHTFENTTSHHNHHVEDAIAKHHHNTHASQRAHHHSTDHHHTSKNATVANDTHSHQFLSFLKKLIDTEEHNSEDAINKSKVDKHFNQQEDFSIAQLSTFNKRSFNYLFKNYNTNISDNLPPPKAVRI